MKIELLEPVCKDRQFPGRTPIGDYEIRANIHLRKNRSDVVVVYLSVGAALFNTAHRYQLMKPKPRQADQGYLTFKKMDKGIRFTVTGKSKKGKAISTEVIYSWLPEPFRKSLIATPEHHVMLTAKLDEDGDFILTLK